MNKKVMKLATRGKRFGAYCLDEVIPAILSIIILIACARIFAMTDYSYGYPYGYGFGYGYGGGMGVGGSVAVITVASLLSLAYLAVQIFFYTKSKTIGKAILGMQVVSSTDGQPVGVWKMLLREWFAKKASGAACLLGYIWILIDDKNRGWHDKICDTYVVDINETAKMHQTVKQETPVYTGSVADVEPEPLDPAEFATYEVNTDIEETDSPEVIVEPEEPRLTGVIVEPFIEEVKREGSVESGEVDAKIIDEPENTVEIDGVSE